MRQPDGPWKQHEGKTIAELLRGCGAWPRQRYPCELQPPWDAWDRESVSPWDCYVNDWDGPWVGGVIANMVASRRVLCPNRSLQLERAEYAGAYDRLAAIVFEQFPDDEATIAKAEQLLLAMPAIRRPVSFEIIGLGAGTTYAENDPVSTRPRIVVQFVADTEDVGNVRHQLLTHYPESAVMVDRPLSEKDEHDKDMLPAYWLNMEGGHQLSFVLSSPYCWSLRRITRLDPDPLAVVTAAMDHLDEEDWAMVQVLFEPSPRAWADTLFEAVRNPYKPGEFLFHDVSAKVLDNKFARPLFAVSIRLIAKTENTMRHLVGWCEQFAAPPQYLAASSDDMVEEFAHAVVARCAYRPGMLLNSDELAALVHLPATSLASTRLMRIKTRTRPVPAEAQGSGVALGENVHRGERQIASIPAKARRHHCYIVGASGTGKSTLLLNMIMQDIEAGEGVGVLDPHGDLVKAVLRRIPPHRGGDVILFDPADEEFPFALNILEAKNETERERIVNETVAALEKYFPASWGPRLERLLHHTLHTVLHAISGGTLADVERLLTDEGFRNIVLARTTAPRLLRYWHNEFPQSRSGAVDPVLNKLAMFIDSRVVRNIVCQRQSTVDFEEVVNGGKILLANLSTGLLTEKVSGTLGSFLVTKIMNVAFRRAAIKEKERRPWYLYIDEFQAFMNVSVGFDRVLSEARKYGLVLAGMANQYFSQLSAEVRQAVFGNVGTQVVFRLGVSDADAVARQLGVFTSEEILSLELGEAIARIGGARSAFNLRTYPPPASPPDDPTNAIIKYMRARYARPRATVEREFMEEPKQPPPPSNGPPNAPPTGSRRRRRRGRTGRDNNQQPRDPSEEDFVT